MFKRGFVGGLLVMLLSVALLRPALAAEIFYVTFDSVDDAPYTINQGSITSGGYSGDALTGEDIGGDVYQMTVDLTIDPSCELTHLFFRYKATNTRPILDIGITASYSDASETLIRDVGTASGGGFADNTWREFEDTPPSLTGIVKIRLLINWAGFSTYGGSALMDNIEYTCANFTASGSITRPLAAADEHPDWGIFDYDYAHSFDPTFEVNYTVEAFSATFGANVAAVRPGTVVSVRPFTPENCAGIEVLSLFFCYVPVPGPISDGSISQIYLLDMIGNWIVTVEDADDSTIQYDYILHAPTVKVGDSVVAGCVLGVTIQIKQFPLGALGLSASILGAGISGGLSFISEPTEAGITLVTKYVSDEAASLYPSLTEQPDMAACKEQALSACVNNNPSLTSFAYYERESDVTLLDGGGVSIPSFNYILQSDILIDPETDYTLSVQARKLETGDDTDSSTMNLQLGSELQSFEVLPDFQNYTFTPATEFWHTDNLTSIFVSNQPSSVAPIEIRYICLAPITASTAPGGCYFANSEFDADGSGWDLVGTTFGTGQAFMRDGDSIAQDVTLKPDDISTPHTYTIRATARILATGDYTGQIGKSVDLNYEYPALTTGAVGTIDSTLVAQQGVNIVSGDVEFDYPYVLTTTIEVSEDTTSTFTLSVDVTDSDHYLNGIRLDSICIDPEGDGTFPGQPGGGGYTPPLIEGCSVVPLPTENTVGPWIFYHWANLRRFFTCDLMKLLNRWFSLFDNFQRTIRGVARWWIALTHRGSSWITSFLWWANGSVRNIAMGQVTTINESGGCHDIFCAIVDVTTTLGNLLTPIVDALNNVVNVLVGVFIGVVNLFFTLIGGLTGFVVALIIKLMSLISIAISLLTGLVGAYNASTPTSIPGLPSCALDPSSSPLCYMVWVADNTIFQGRWNTLFNILLSILAIHLILYTVREVKAIVMETWSSS